MCRSQHIVRKIQKILERFSSQVSEQVNQNIYRQT